MSTTYEQFKHTKFPDSLDDAKTYGYLQDVPDSLYSVVKQYQSAFASGDTAKCKTLLTNNPDLAKCMWKAIDYNWMRDAVLAMETLYLEDIEKKIAEKVGINDSMLPTNANAGKNTWSIKKIDAELHKKLGFVVSANSTTSQQNAWTHQSNGYYKKTITQSFFEASKDYQLLFDYDQLDNFSITGNVNVPTDAKNRIKQFGYIVYGISHNGSMDIYATKKPTDDIPVVFKEV